jgi:hypothetical protein
MMRRGLWDIQAEVAAEVLQHQIRWRMIRNGDWALFILAVLGFCTVKTEIYIYIRKFVSFQFLDILIK